MWSVIEKPHEQSGGNHLALLLHFYNDAPNILYLKPLNTTVNSQRHEGHYCNSGT